MSRADALDTGTTNYLDLIGNGKAYRVPPYQRDYAWTQQEWEDLWNDVVELRGDPAGRHYMGALVVQARGDREFLVIDGPGAVFRHLRPLYVDDDRFESAFARWTVGTRGRRGKIARYVLARLETDAGERAVDPETDPATVEHVLPENPAGEWAEVFPPERREAAVDRLGNLTLLERTWNRSVGSAAYPAKRVAYESSAYAITREIAGLAPDEWSPALLEERQRRLAARAVRLWRADFA